MGLCWGLGQLEERELTHLVLGSHTCPRGAGVRGTSPAAPLPASTTFKGRNVAGVSPVAPSGGGYEQPWVQVPALLPRGCGALASVVTSLSLVFHTCELGLFAVPAHRAAVRAKCRCVYPFRNGYVPSASRAPSRTLGTFNSWCEPCEAALLTIL